MGCDGGTIPRRHELVRTRQKKEEKDKDSELQWRWGYCSLSHQKLVEPIVACELGRLYNKDAVIEYLLDKSSHKAQFGHLKGLKDVHGLTLTRNPGWQGGSLKGDAYVDTHLAPFICPVAGIGMSGRYKFVFLLGCKCSVSDRAMKEVRGSSCPSCSTEYADCDVITLNPTQEEEDVLFERMEKRREIARAERLKRKKEKKKEKKENLAEIQSSAELAAKIENLDETCTKSTSGQQNPGTSGTSGRQNGAPGTSGRQNGAPGTSGRQNGAPGTSGRQNGAPGTSGRQNGAPGTSGRQSGAPGTSGRQNGAPGTSGRQNGAPGTSGRQNGAPGTSGRQNGAPGTSGRQSGAPGTSGHQNGAPGTSGRQNGAPGVKSLTAASAVVGAKHKLREEKIFQTTTFKSLFTSHESAKKAKDKNGHWVTYNPYHYAG